MDGENTGVRKLIFAFGGLLALTVAACVAAPAFALTPQQIFAKDAPSVVVIVAYDAGGKPVELGSGVVIAKGQVVTNCHVVKNGATLQIKQGKTAYSATLHYADSDHDLCQLSVAGLSAPAVVMGNAKTLRPGASVVAIGAPEGLDLTISSGLVSSLRDIGDGTKIIQTSAAISPGSSGGGLFDDQGRLVGITFAYLTKGQNLNFALPVNWIAGLPDYPAGTHTETTSSVDWLAAAVALERKNDWAGLLEHGQRWIKVQPQSVVAWGSIADATFHMGNFIASRQAYARISELRPNVALSWTNLGEVDAAVGQYIVAIDEYRRAIKLDPTDAKPWEGLGAAYQNLQQFSKAKAASEEAIRLDPTDETAWYNLGGTYAALLQFVAAEKAVMQAIRLEPDDARVWFRLGLLRTAQGDRDGTIEAYKHLRKLDPAMADKLFNLAILPQ